MPSLRFDPYAWGKLVYLRDRGRTEIGGFGLSADDDLLLIVDILTMKQRCTPVTVAFDDVSIADLFDDLAGEGLHSERFARIWIHTHPGTSALPSRTDEATFRRVFSQTEWAVMAIVARNDATYARLAFHTGPGGSMEIPMTVDFRQPFDAADRQAWEHEYINHVLVAPESRFGACVDSQDELHSDGSAEFGWAWERSNHAPAITESL